MTKLKPRMPHIRPQVAGIEEQQILAVSRLALGDPSVIPLWYGESDIPTPQFICEAAAEAMRAGETFYTHKRGIPELRQALAGYMGRLYGRDVDVERVSVTSSGMTAIMMMLQCMVDPGDNVIIVSPVWPNAQSAVRLMGGEPRYVTLDPGGNGWHLDMGKLAAACDARTRAIFVNSPNNPTGWMMPAGQLAEMLALARERGIWILSDEVYARMVYDRPAAPSFLEVAEPDDPVIVINSFSKSWAMTGWRMGWLVHPPEHGDLFGNVIEFNYSCVAQFLQRAGVTAIEQGGPFVAEMLSHCRRGRDIVDSRLPRLKGVTDYRTPEASFYAFFRIDGVTDSLGYARDLVRGAHVGIAPGTAFGPGAETWFRLCFAQTEDTLNEAFDRLEGALGTVG